jgi:hypothetical protein
MRKIQTLLVKQSEHDEEAIYSHFPNNKIVRLQFKAINISIVKIPKQEMHHTTQ